MLPNVKHLGTLITKLKQIFLIGFKSLEKRIYIVCLEYFNFSDSLNSQDCIVSIIKTLNNINTKMKVYMRQNNLMKIDSKENSDKKAERKQIDVKRKSSKLNLDVQMNYINMKYK